MQLDLYEDLKELSRVSVLFNKADNNADKIILLKILKDKAYALTYSLEKKIENFEAIANI